MKKNKNFLKKLTAGILGFVMTLGVGAAGYAASAGEAQAVAPDTLNASNFSAGGSYGNVSYTGSSGSVYAGQMMKDNSNNMQMRSKNSNSGIVMTRSAGNIASVVISVGSGSNSIDVYGSNTAYNSPSDLYSSPGTQIGSTTTGGTITFTDDYEYFGLRSNNGAIYVASITVNFKSGSTNYTVSFNSNGGTSSMSSATTIGDSYVAPSCGFTAPTGKEFDKWALGSASGTQYAVGETITGISSDISLYALWKKAVVKYTDNITYTTTGVTSTSYTEFSGKNKTNNPNDIKSDAVYAGKIARNNNSGTLSLQMNKNTGAFWTTASGGCIRSISIEATNWNNGKTVDIYGNSSAYSSLVTSGNPSGTKLGTISSSASTLTVSGDHEYVYFFSSGAIYLKNVRLVWEPKAVHTVTISNFPSSNFYAGESVTLSASCDQTDCEGITWNSSNPTVASISSSGKVIGLSGGTTTITASCPEGGSDSKTLTVVGNGLTLSPSAITDAKKGGTGSITASLNAAVTGVSYSWESNQPGVVSITSGATSATVSLSYVGGGTATLTCTASVNDVTFTNTCDVTVVTKDPTVSFDNPPSSGYTGISYDFTAVSANIDNGTWSWKVNDQDFSFDDDLDDGNTSVRFATFTEAGSYTIKATCTDENDATSTATATTTIVITASSSVLTIDKNSIELQKGSKISITPTLVVTGSYADKTTITVTKEGGVTLDKLTTTSGSPVEVTAGSTGGVAKVIFSANGQNVECAISIPKTTVDVITGKSLGLSSTSYADFSGKTFVSEAVYAGKAALEDTTNDVLKLNKDTGYGIYTSVSGGVFSKLEVDWDSSTSNDRQFAIYGMNSAPSGVEDEGRGDPLGKIDYSKSETVFVASESYKYIILKAEKGAVYFNNIKITWTEPTPVESVTAGQKSISVAKGASSQLTWTVLPADASNNAVEFSMNPELTGVSISESGLVEVTKDATVDATSTITIASKENSSIKDTVSLTILDTYLDETKVLGRTGFKNFTTEQTFASVRNSSNYLTVKYIDGTEVKSYNDGAEIWNNVVCYKYKNASDTAPDLDSQDWEVYTITSNITSADNGKWFKFVYTEDGYTQTSNAFNISVDAVTIKSSLTLYYSNSDSYAHSHDFTQDDEYSATSTTVAWSILNKPSQAEISDSGVLTIVRAPSSGTTMQFTVRATCGNAKSECIVTLLFEPVTSISINETSLTEVAHGTKGTLSATVESEYALQEVKWESSDSATLSVTGQSGNKLKANYEAAESITEDKNVTVTCWADENGNNVKDPFEEAKQAQKIIKVVAGEIAVTSITLDPSSVEIWQDEIDDDNNSIKITPTLNPGATVKTLQWEIVEGSDNVVTLGSSAPSQTKQLNYTGNAGEATIKATSMNEEHEQVSQTLTVTVKESKLTSITADSSASTIVKEFELGHEFGPSDYSGLSVNATFSSGNEKPVDLSNCVITCDTSKVGTSKVNISYTFNDVTQTTSFDVTIHAPSLNVVKKTVTETHGDPIGHDAGITSGEQLLNNGVGISNIEVENPGYVVTKLEFVCKYNKSIDPAVTVEAKIGNTSLGSQTVGNNFNGTLIFENTTKATGQIVFSFTNHCTASSKCGTFYWYTLTMYDEGETIRTTSYSNNKMSDAMYAFIDEYSDDLSAGKWDTIFSSSEYAALSANDKALFKDGVVSGTDDSGTKTSSKEFADFINKYDEVLATNDGLTNYLDRPLAQTYTITIDYNHDGQTSTVKVLPGDYKLPEAPEYSGYVFQGWTVGSEVKDAGSTITVTGNMTITANWAVGITFTNSAEFNFTGLTMNRFQYVFEGTCPQDAQKSGFLVSTTGNTDLLRSLTDDQIKTGNNEGVTEKNKADNKLVIGTSDGSKTVSVMFYYVDVNGKVVKSEVITMSFDSFVTAKGFDPSIYGDKYAIAALQYYIAGLQAK